MEGIVRCLSQLEYSIMSLLCEYVTLTSMRVEAIINLILLILAIVGAFISIKTFINSTKQRRIENTYKTLDFLRQHIKQNEINTFIKLFNANNELIGAARNEFSLTMALRIL